ncbi:hypothetical protein EWM64_g5422 [Hericium alpestre]|uniref:4Fe-4S ferredoxin-type domain-containing protein n=1 Tax=Hericium alpestre TaxID=135208 RepID=A0A4Y9ZVM4_9AGAM|nr:hypothetical protein EWM64_g5422 [Hericium alpestre]
MTLGIVLLLAAFTSRVDDGGPPFADESLRFKNRADDNAVCHACTDLDILCPGFEVEGPASRVSEMREDIR